MISFYSYAEHADLHSFPTRRSSDLVHGIPLVDEGSERPSGRHQVIARTGGHHQNALLSLGQQDRKSTRLNSSHVATSYAVFCLKKKINVNTKTRTASTTTAIASTRP